jgi:hypothetical protein
MAYIRTFRSFGVASVLLALSVAPLAAQGPALAVGLGAGASSLPTHGPDPRVGRWHSLLVVGLAPSGWRAELRGDLMWAHWPSYAGPVSGTVNALLPVGGIRIGQDARVRPYVIGGAGYYGVGTSRPELGANAGLGARLELPRLTTFIEGRRHSAYARTFVTFGLALRR